VPLAVTLTGANRNDVTQLMPLLDAVPPVRGRRGRPRRRPNQLYADRGYDHVDHLLAPAQTPPVIALGVLTLRAKERGLLPSMGSIGDCFDNAMMESFWGRMQTELVDRQRWRTRVEPANAIFEYLEIFHNRQRRHSALGMLTPIEHERLHTVPTVA